MSRIGARLKELGLILPEPLKGPPGLVLPFPWVNIRGDRAFVSGHGPQEADGSPSGPFGSVGDSISVEQGREVARKVGLSVLGSLQRELGDLDRISGWCRVFGMVNCVPGFDKPSAVINGFSELILDVFGPEVGRHARSAIGVAGLPLNFPVEVEAEIVITG